MRIRGGREDLSILVFFLSISLALAEQRCSFLVFLEFYILCEPVYAVSRVSICRMASSESDRSPHSSESVWLMCFSRPLSRNVSDWSFAINSWASKCMIDLSVSSKFILVGFGSPSLSFSYIEKGIRLILAPRSAKALSMCKLPISQGIVKLPGSFSLSGSLFNKTAEHLSFIVIVQASSSLILFGSRIIALEKEVAELKKDPLHTQVTTLVDDHLDTRLGATREKFMNFLSALLTARIQEQVKNQLPQILPEEVSKFAPPMIEKMIEESFKEVTLAKGESYMAAPEHRECYDSLIKSYNFDKDFFSSYDVYSLKRSRKDKVKDEDPSARSYRGLKKRNTSKDAEPTTGPKNKDSTSGSSKGTKSQPKSSRKSVQSEEPEFEVADSDMPQDQEGNLGNDDDEPRKKATSRHDWFTKPTQPQEPSDPDWNVGKTPQKGPTQNWLMTLTASTDKSLMSFDKLMSTPIDFSALLEKLDWENPEGGDYPFDLSKPLPLVMSGNRQRVPVDYFINNDLKYLRILAVTHVNVMRKHGYGYLEEVVVRIANNDLYRFKECDFPRLRINDVTPPNRVASE
ncbi:hypothetical protein Tco_0677137 [Tanacetum coccineum]